MTRARLKTDIAGAVELNCVVDRVGCCVAPRPLPVHSLRPRRSGSSSSSIGPVCTADSRRPRRTRGARWSRSSSCPSRANHSRWPCGSGRARCSGCSSSSGRPSRARDSRWSRGPGGARSSGGSSNPGRPGRARRSRWSRGSDLRQNAPIRRTAVGFMTRARLNADIAGPVELHRIVDGVGGGVVPGPLPVHSLWPRRPRGSRSSVGSVAPVCASDSRRPRRTRWSRSSGCPSRANHSRWPCGSGRALCSGCAGSSGGPSRARRSR